MSDTPTTPITPVKKKRTYRNLTPSQRAEAVALWRTGSVTLEDLGKKFKKSPETLSRMFSRMGIVKGEAAEAAAKKMAERVEAAAMSSIDETLRKIAETRDEHYKMSSGISRLVWNELIRARKAGTDIADLKDMMATLKLAGEIIGNSRKEIFAILNVEKHDESSELDELPELTVRELTNTEILDLQSRQGDEGSLTGADDIGGAMLPEDGVESL